MEVRTMSGELHEKLQNTEQEWKQANTHRTTNFKNVMDQHQRNLNEWN